MWRGSWAVHLIEAQKILSPRETNLLLWREQENVREIEVSLRELKLITIIQEGRNIGELGEFAAQANFKSEEFHTLFKQWRSNGVIVGWKAQSVSQ